MNSFQVGGENKMPREELAGQENKTQTIVSVLRNKSPKTIQGFRGSYDKTNPGGLCQPSYIRTVTVGTGITPVHAL